MWRERLVSRLEERRASELWRHRICRDDTLIDFAGNDYLGLAGHPRLAEAQADAARRYGAGSGASHLVSGHLALHDDLESRLAALTGRPRALLFSTGYMANLGVLQALGDRYTLIFQDRLNHASLLDGAILCGARSRRFHHRDLTDLERLLASGSTSACKLVVSDGVFSMDGDVADIAGLATLSQRYGAALMIDDAHGLGVLGTIGDGCVGSRFDTEAVPILVGTLGKALGSFGAFVAGDEMLIDTLIQFARPYAYTTALPPGVAASTLAALDTLALEPERRTRLSDNIRTFRRLAAQAGLPLLDSRTPIQPLLLGDARRALSWQSALAHHGLRVGAIRPPTVPSGQSRLRITLSATHTPDMLQRLVETLDTLHREATACLA